MTQPTSDFEGPVESSGRTALLHDRRAIAGIAVAVVAVGAVAYLLLSGGSSASPTASGTVQRGKVTATATASASPTAAVGATAAPALRVRDPFSPLYTAPSAAAGGSGASSTTTTATSSAPDPTASSSAPTIVVVEPTSSVKPTATVTVTPAKAKYTLTFVKVLSTATETIQVKLNGVTYTLSKTNRLFPDAVNGPFELTSLVTSVNGKAESDGPAQFMYGDLAFSMLVGETQTEN